MKARNVIITLIVVLALLVFVFMKVRLEPKKRMIFNRNPSRIEYTAFALCRMDCYGVNANSVTQILRTARASKADYKTSCPSFILDILTKQNKHIFIILQQCGTVAKIVDCYDAKSQAPCNCMDREKPHLSYFKTGR